MNVNTATLAMIVTDLTLATLTIFAIAILVNMPSAIAQADLVKIGNPHDFRPGPPIPSCNADFH